EKVAAVSQKLGQALYADAQAAQAAGGDAGQAPSDTGPTADGGEDIVDAEIVDEDKREGGGG
ncbi:hypothetical protein, partial [Streptomyces vietnamensis]|uniref:hypothetical protein n=1 Tax=Streptomyces vietnamensis TaxID=362257 RepID=UPI003440E2B5